MTGAPADEAPLKVSRREALIALGASWALFFANAIFGPTLVPYYRDHLVTNIPVRDYVRERLLNGEVPHWFPYEGLGVPLIGQIALGTWHPLNLLTLPLPAIYGEKWALLFAYLLGLIGAYRAGRALGVSRPAAILGAWTWGFGGYVLGMSSIIAYAMSTAALPWVVWAATRVVEKLELRHAAALALSAALVFIAGDALGYSLVGLLCLIALAAKPSRRAVLLFGAAGVWSALLVGIELLPATVIGADSVRNVGQAPASLAFTWATHPLRLLELLHAGLIPDEVRPQVLNELLGGGTAVFATTLYFGVLAFGALAAALAAWPKLTRSAKAAVALALVALLLATGEHLGLLGVLQAALPVLGKFRYPERYLAFFWVAMLWLVPLGFERALGEGRRAFRIGLGLAGALNLFMLTPAAVDVLWALKGKVPAEQLAAHVAEAWRGSGAVGLIVAIGAALVVQAHAPRTRWMLLGALLFLDLWRGNGHHLPLIEADTYQPSPFAAAVRTGSAPFGRVASLAQRQWSSGVTLAGKEEWVAGTLGRLRPTCASLSRVETLGSNLGATQRRHALVLGVHDTQLPRLAGFFNGCWAVVDDAGAAPEGAVRAEQLALRLEARECWPRVFLARTVATTLDGSVSLLGRMSLAEHRVPWEGPRSIDSEEGTLKLRSPRPEEWLMEIDAPQPTALVVTNDFIPGWSATLDGAEVPIYPAIGTALGVELPAGVHRVALVYSTPRFGLGAALTALGLALLLAVTVTSLRDRKKRAVMAA